eukprot:1282334-Rhodomonas_salina.1
MEELEIEIGQFVKNKAPSAKIPTPAPTVRDSTTPPAAAPAPTPEIVCIRKSSTALIAALQGKETNNSPI